MPETHFATALREWRNANGHDQQTVADVLGISRKTYGYFEGGRWNVPERERAYVLTKLLGFDANVGALFAQHYDLELPAPAPATPVAAAPVAAVALPAPDPYAANDSIARSIVEATLYSVAERLELTPRVVRAVASAVLARLVAERVSAVRAAHVVTELEAEIEARRTPA
jgi:transcriptional regulator with XRE-family HTH domain